MWAKYPGIKNISSLVLVSVVTMRLSSSVLLLVSSSNLSTSTPMEDQTYRKDRTDNFSNDVYIFGDPSNVKNHRDLFNADNDMYLNDGR